MNRRVLAGGAAAATLVATAFALIPSVAAQARDRSVAPDPGVLLLFEGASQVGVSVRELTAEEFEQAKQDRPAGVFVEAVREGSPAARAGLQEGDILLAFDGERIRGVRHFARLVAETPPGAAVLAEVVRGGSRLTLDVTPEASDRLSALWPELRREIERGLRSIPRDLPWPPERQRTGLTLMPLGDQLATYFGVRAGVLVSSVEPGSPAADAGMRAGDVITAIDGRTPRTPADAMSSLRASAPGATLEVRVVREKKDLAVRLTLRESRPRRPGQIPI